MIGSKQLNQVEQQRRGIEGRGDDAPVLSRLATKSGGHVAGDGARIVFFSEPDDPI